MIVGSVCPYRIQKVNTVQRNNFRGAGQEVISEGMKEFVSEALPVYKTVRVLYKAGQGDARGVLKQGVAVADNIVFQPAKQALATTVAAKGAAIGSVILPGVGTAVGAAIGYLGTILCWGKARNAIVDEMMD